MEFESQYPVTPFIPNNANGKKVAKQKFELEIRQCKVEIEHHHWTKSKWKTGNTSRLVDRIENVKKKFIENEKPKKQEEFDHIDKFLKGLTKHEKKILETR